MLTDLIQRTCPECQVAFTTNRHNKKYCSKECCVRATNKAILQRYHENKKTKKKKKLCQSCGAELSTYNDGNVCSLCERREQDVKRVDLLKELGFFNYVQE